MSIWPLKACSELVCGFSRINSRKLTMTSEEILMSSISSLFWFRGSRKLPSESETSSNLASFGGSAEKVFDRNLYKIFKKNKNYHMINDG